MQQRQAGQGLSPHVEVGTDALPKCYMPPPSSVGLALGPTTHVTTCLAVTTALICAGRKMCRPAELTSAWKLHQ